MLTHGLIQVYTTDSHYFNFAPFGLALRAAGYAFRILITSFTAHGLEKDRGWARALGPSLVIDESAVPATGPHQKIHEAEVLGAFNRARAAVMGGYFDLVILSGVFEALGEMIPTKEVLAMMEQKPAHVELVLSGSRAEPAVLDRADLVTEMVVQGPQKKEEKREAPTEAAGKVEIITGEGKGKTTYCLGKAMLIASQGVPSLILQVIKSPRPYGEVMAIERLENLQIKTMGQGFLHRETPPFEKKHVEAARRAWEFWLREIYSLKYGLLVLDEINIATHYGLIRPERVKEMLFLKPPPLQLLLSGRNAHPEVCKAATRVLEMKEIRHPYKQGIMARRGIEF